MTEIVTLDEAKLYLRVSHDDEDSVIITLIGAASEAISATADAWDAGAGVPDRIKLAVLARISAAYVNREALDYDGGPAGELRLINTLRNLTI